MWTEEDDMDICRHLEKDYVSKAKCQRSQFSLFEIQGRTDDFFYVSGIHNTLRMGLGAREMGP